LIQVNTGPADLTSIAPSILGACPGKVPGQCAHVYNVAAAASGCASAGLVVEFTIYPLFSPQVRYRGRRKRPTTTDFEVRVKGGRGAPPHIRRGGDTPRALSEGGAGTRQQAAALGRGVPRRWSMLGPTPANEGGTRLPERAPDRKGAGRPGAVAVQYADDCRRVGRRGAGDSVFDTSAVSHQTTTSGRSGQAVNVEVGGTGGPREPARGAWDEFAGCWRPPRCRPAAMMARAMRSGVELSPASARSTIYLFDQAADGPLRPGGPRRGSTPAGAATPHRYVTFFQTLV